MGFLVSLINQLRCKVITEELYDLGADLSNHCKRVSWSSAVDVAPIMRHVCSLESKWLGCILTQQINKVFEKHHTNLPNRSCRWQGKSQTYENMMECS